MSVDAYEGLRTRSRRWNVLHSVNGLLQWDQETLMPKEGTGLRAEQVALLSGMVHEEATSNEVGDLLAACESNGFASDSVEAANVREWRRDYERATKLPKAHVEALSHLRTVAQVEWAKARSERDFSIFAPHLSQMMDMMRQTAEYLGWPDDGEPYDALLEDYEPGATAAEIESIFTPLRDRLASLIAEIADAPQRPDDSIHQRSIPVEQQKAFVEFVAESIGFSFNKGRLDISTHPFCQGVGPGDCRITTRFHDDNIMDALSSTMHEAGHGIYEQGLATDQFGAPCGTSVSLGIHESQSRGWENIIGRSRAFWEWCLPHAQRFMPDAFGDQTVESVFQAQNIVKPSYIRVEADEATYNLHVMLRFQIERDLLSGKLDVNDVPAVWNETFKKMIGIEVDHDSNGCLQDVHWSCGLVGYFPTYTLGSLYASQIFDAAAEALPNLDDQVRQGKFEALRTWLTENIHAHGRRYTASQLCERTTGRPLSADPLMNHLNTKLRPIYGI